jgi:hypothetical protein
MITTLVIVGLVAVFMAACRIVKRRNIINGYSGDGLCGKINWKRRLL